MSTDSSPAAASFRAFEHAAWESNVAEYDAAYARVTCQSNEPLLDAVAARAGTRLLDVATGPGYLAAAALQRGVRVTGIDFSAPMVERARADNPGAAFEVGDAEALSFPDGSFDAVVMNFGMLHLAQPERAMAEAARVLVPGGRFAFTVWDAPDQAVAFGLVLGSIRTLGSMDVPLPAGPPFFRFSEAGECERTLRDAGFTDVRVSRVPQVWRFDPPAEPFEAVYNGGVRIRAMLRAQTREAFDAIHHAVRAGTQKYLRNGVIEMPMPAVMACATKPA